MSSERRSSDTIKGSISTTEKIRQGLGSGSNNGFINSGRDQDWFRITLRAGEQYQFQATAPNRGEGGMVLNPKLFLRNSEGDRGAAHLAYNDNSGGTKDSRILYTATTTGTYYLDVGGVTVSAGAYVVRAREVPGNASTYAKLAVDATRTGDIHSASDHDWVAIKLKAGQSYTFQQRGSATDDGTLADTFLFLRDASGKIVAQDDNSGVGSNSLINFTVRTGGTYYLDASSAGGHTGSYELSFDLLV